MKKNEIKTVSLTVDEIRQLLSVESAAERKAIADALTESASNPDDVDAGRYLDAHPMALCLAHKISRKVEMRRRRAEARRKRQDEAKRKQHVVAAAPRASERVVSDAEMLNEIEFNQTVVKRLLWLKRNHSSWCRSLFGVLRSLKRDVVPQDLVSDVEACIEGLWDYLSPLVDRASDYYRTPPAQRCGSVVF